MTSTLPALAQATSGALGSACANSVAYPLDVICTRLQTKRRQPFNKSKKQQPSGLVEIVQLLRSTIRRKGFSGLYAGLGSDTASTLLSNFLYFYSYSFLRKLVQKRALSHRPPGSDLKKAATVALSVPQELGIGYLAGVLSRLVTTPLSVITVRLQSENDKDDDAEAEVGMLGTARDIYEEDGLLGFWKGFQSTIVLSSNPAITLLLFQLFRRLFLQGKNRDHPTPFQAFVLGGLSNSIAVSLLYPLILIKTRIQSTRKALSTGATSKKDEAMSASPLEIAEGVIRRDGVSGLYQGLQAQLLKGIISQGLTLSIKQRIEDNFVRLYRLAVERAAATA